MVELNLIEVVRLYSVFPAEAGRVVLLTSMLLKLSLKKVDFLLLKEKFFVTSQCGIVATKEITHK